MPIQPAIFETHEIRRVYDEAGETWRFSVVDIITDVDSTAGLSGGQKLLEGAEKPFDP
jgi:hypothetical protein